MRVWHLTEKDYKVSNWSGGTTTELFIWPEGADYAKREFSVRVSSARVELAESDFTPLAGVTRYITPLSGGFTLSHPGGRTVVMGPLEAPYRFSGDTPTHCVGIATDLNLMLKGVEGEMGLCSQVWQLRPGLNCLYAPESVRVGLGAGYGLRPGQLLVVLTDSACQAPVTAKSVACWADCRGAREETGNEDHFSGY